MKKENIVLGVFFLVLISFYATAQKLPNVQTNSQWLPLTVNIDGKLSEWPESLQAYNKATRLEYTIANDNKRLYLAIKSVDKTTTAKILAGGIRFTLNAFGKNNQGYDIIFPATNSIYTYSKAGWPEPNFKLASDSSDILNAIMELKEIKVLRFKGISDSILSIYNPYSIKSKLAYSNEELICELLVPFDLVGLSQENPAPITYNIRLNGVQIPPRPPGIPKPAPPPAVVIPEGIERRASPGSYILTMEIESPVFFGGKYILSKASIK